MSALTLYTHPQSRGRIVRWMLEEIGQPYEIRVMDFEGSLKSPEYLKLNPMGKVPMLTSGDLVVTEVVAICAWLADRFPEAGLAPPLNDPARGSYYRWLFFIAGPLEMATTAKAYQWRIDAENRSSVGCGLITDPLDAIEQTLTTRDYLCGDRFTTADLLMASYLGWEMLMKIIEPRPVFEAYVARCEQRPAAARATALDDALLPEKASA